MTLGTELKLPGKFFTESEQPITNVEDLLERWMGRPKKKMSEKIGTKRNLRYINKEDKKY